MKRKITKSEYLYNKHIERLRKRFYRNGIQIVFGLFPFPDLKMAQFVANEYTSFLLEKVNHGDDNRS